MTPGLPTSRLPKSLPTLRKNLAFLSGHDLAQIIEEIYQEIHRTMSTTQTDFDAKLSAFEGDVTALKTYVSSLRQIALDAIAKGQGAGADLTAEAGRLDALDATVKDILATALPGQQSAPGGQTAGQSGS